MEKKITRRTLEWYKQWARQRGEIDIEVSPGHTRTIVFAVHHDCLLCWLRCRSNPRDQWLGYRWLSAYPDHDIESEKREVAMGVLQQLQERQREKGLKPVLVDADGFKKYPNLAEFMTVEEFDGSPRRTGTMNVFFDDGCLKAFLNDRQTNQYTVVTSETLTGLLAAVEKALGSPNTDWRRNKDQQGWKGKKGGGR